MSSLAARVRHLADAAAELGHTELSVELHEAARAEERREPDAPERVISALLTLLEELAEQRSRHEHERDG